MSHISASIEKIRSAFKQLGARELSRRSGVPYTTLRDWELADFRPKAVELLEKLEAVCADDTMPEKVDSGKPRQPEASRA